MSTMFIEGKWLSAALLATFAAAPAGAQQSPAGARNNSYALTLENDSHFDTDRYYTERRAARARLSFNLWRDVRLNTATYWRIGAGNIMTYAAGGVAVVVGKNLPLVSRQPPGIENKLAGARPGASTICVWRWLQCTAFGSVEARAVAYNVFLDGRAWRDVPQVKRRLWVADLSSGVRFDFPNTRSAGHGPWFMQFKITRRSPEFRSSLPARRHIVGAWTIGTEF